MGKTSYDDWNFMGEIQKEDRKARNAKASKHVNSQKNSFIFICVVCVMTLLGLVCVYSASYPQAVAAGIPHYAFLVNQVIYVAIGVFLMILVNLLPEKTIKILSPIMLLACIVALGANPLLGKKGFITSENVNLVFLSGVMYLSLYFSNRGNKIEKIRQLIVPGICCLVVFGLVLLQKNLSFALMYLALSITMFAAGGVGVVGVVILLLYALVPLLCAVLSKPDRILAVARFLIPGYGTNPRIEQTAVIRSAIASGSWFGKGLGLGEFKTGAIDYISSKCIFANICEEIGLWGVVLIVLFFAMYAFVGYNTSKAIRKQDGFYSNLALGVTTMVVWQFILNVLWVLGFLSIDGLSMPFFSYGAGSILIMLESGILFKISKIKVEVDDTDKIVETFQEELLFPEKYEFENS